MTELFVPILFLAIIAGVTVVAMIYLPDILATRTKSRRKTNAYECGLIPEVDARGRFPVKYFLVAIDFVIFDIEVVFLYPWAIVYKDLGMYGFASMGIFLLVLILGFFYVVGKGGLRWQ